MRLVEVLRHPPGKEVRGIGHHAADDQGNRLEESGAAQRQNRGRVRKGEWHNVGKIADGCGGIEPAASQCSPAPLLDLGSAGPAVVLLYLYPRAQAELAAL